MSDTATVWASVPTFIDDLLDEIARGPAKVEHLGQFPGVSLRVPIVRYLFGHPMSDAVEIREHVLSEAGMDPDSARCVNLHAFALKGLVEDGWIRGVRVKGRTRKAYALNSTVRAVLSELAAYEHYRASQP